MLINPRINQKQIFIITSVFIAFLLIFFSSGHAATQQTAARQILKTDYWGTHWQKVPWMKRVQPAPGKLLDYLKEQNKLDGFSEVPIAVTPAPEISDACKDISLSLSPALNKLLNERLIGIFSVKDLGGSGFAEEILDETSHKPYAIIVLDRDVLLKRKANEWASWKENSIFQPKQQGGLRLQMTIASEKDNTVQNAVRYLLLHELGHSLGLISNIHPSWNSSDKSISQNYSFMKLSWKPDNQGKSVSLFDDKFPERKNIRFYSFDKAQLTNEEMPVVYGNLQQSTNFVSMQASTNVWEDFAESFVTYVHVLQDKKPWQVRIENDKGRSTVINACWSEKRCAEKKIFMDRWFDKP
jgi:hypothetical protein